MRVGTNRVSTVQQREPTVVDDTSKPVPVRRVTMKLRRTRAGEWACYFMFEGKMHEFVRPEIADAVMAAGDFLETQGPIELMRIIEQPH
jgi:hypothetical protein